MKLSKLLGTDILKIIGLVSNPRILRVLLTSVATMALFSVNLQEGSESRDIVKLQMFIK